MKHKTYTLIFSFAVIVLLGGFSKISACSCWQETPVCEAFGDAKAIFVGEVVEGNSVETMRERLKINSNSLSFDFKVKQNFLGTEVGKSFTVKTGVGFGDCGFPFKKGETYLVYAYEDGDEVTTGICTRTRHISRVTDDISALDSLLLGNGAKLSGTVTQYAKSKAETDSKQPLDKLKLRVSQTDGDKKTFDISTDKDGKYSLADLPTGKYKILPSLPKGLMVEDYQTAEFLLNDKGCAVKDIHVKNTSMIAGKVVDEKGNPVTDVKIELIPVGLISSKDVKEGEYSYIFENEFRMYHVPAGKYYLAANLSGVPSESSPYKASFYGKSGELADATVIEVKQGESIEGLTIKLSEPLPMTEIRGKVFYADGKPAKGVDINLRDFAARQNISDDETNEKGEFVVKGFVGRKYILESALFNSRIEIEYEAKDVVFTLDEKTGEFKLVLEKGNKE